MSNKEKLEYFQNKLKEIMGKGLPKKYLETTELGDIDKEHESKFKERIERHLADIENLKYKFMNNERYQEIIDEVYKKYNQIIDEVYKNYLGGGHIKWLKPKEYDTPMGKINVPTLYSKEELIEKCKTDPEFSEKWRLKIEERELSQRERVKLLQEAWKNNGIMPDHEEVSTLWVEYNNLMTKYNIPTKLITITYKDEKIEVYE